MCHLRCIYSNDYEHYTANDQNDERRIQFATIHLRRDDAHVAHDVYVTLSLILTTFTPYNKSERNVYGLTTNQRALKKLLTDPFEWIGITFIPSAVQDTLYTQLACIPQRAALRLLNSHPTVLFLCSLNSLLENGLSSENSFARAAFARVANAKQSEETRVKNNANAKIWTLRALGWLCDARDDCRLSVQLCARLNRAFR